MQLPSPLFVKTSRGYINLALVRQVWPNKDEDIWRFIFGDNGDHGCGWEDLPTKEAEIIIFALQAQYPDLFLSA